MQPILVRPAPGVAGEHQIVAGERRWRAAQKAGLREVPVIIREFDDAEALEIAVLENVQRADLNAIEEASGYRALMERFGRTQDAVATAIGKSRSHVANTLRLLALPAQIQTWLAEGKLTAGHARAVATAPDPVALAQLIIDGGLSVREAEALAKKAEAGPASKPKPAPAQGRRHLRPGTATVGSAWPDRRDRRQVRQGRGAGEVRDARTAGSGLPEVGELNLLLAPLAGGAG